jgi:hypothetical protein
MSGNFASIAATAHGASVAKTKRAGWCAKAIAIDCERDAKRKKTVRVSALGRSLTTLVRLTNSTMAVYISWTAKATEMVPFRDAEIASRAIVDFFSKTDGEIGILLDRIHLWSDGHEVSVDVSPLRSSADHAETVATLHLACAQLNVVHLTCHDFDLAMLPSPNLVRRLRSITVESNRETLNGPRLAALINGLPRLRTLVLYGIRPDDLVSPDSPERLRIESLSLQKIHWDLRSISEDDNELNDPPDDLHIESVFAPNLNALCVVGSMGRTDFHRLTAWLPSLTDIEIADSGSWRSADEEFTTHVVNLLARVQRANVDSFDPAAIDKLAAAALSVLAPRATNITLGWYCLSFSENNTLDMPEALVVRNAIRSRTNPLPKFKNLNVCQDDFGPIVPIRAPTICGHLGIGDTCENVRVRFVYPEIDATCVEFSGMELNDDAHYIFNPNVRRVKLARPHAADVLKRLMSTSPWPDVFCDKTLHHNDVPALLQLFDSVRPSDVVTKIIENDGDNAIMTLVASMLLGW